MTRFLIICICIVALGQVPEVRLAWYAVRDNINAFLDQAKPTDVSREQYKRQLPPGMKNPQAGKP